MQGNWTIVYRINNGAQMYHRNMLSTKTWHAHQINMPVKHESSLTLLDIFNANCNPLPKQLKAFSLVSCQLLLFKFLLQTLTLQRYRWVDPAPPRVHNVRLCKQTLQRF